MIGSSNYSYRSNRRDTECQLYILPECEDLKKRLHLEAENLYKNAEKVTLESIAQCPDRPTWKEKVLNRLVKNLI